MERNIKCLLTITMIVTMAILNTACGSHSGSGSSSTTTTGIPPVTKPVTGTGTSSGNTVTLSFEQSALNAYVGGATNDPTDLQATVSLSQLNAAANGDGTFSYSYGGTITISFTDGSNQYSDSFSSNLQGGENTISSNVENNEYNLVSNDYPGEDGAQGYHGFFQGTTYCSSSTGYSYAMSPGDICEGNLFGGAVILVLNNMGGTPDSEGDATATGSIYFYNIVSSSGTGPLPGTSCWFISAGPYGCRTWESGSGVNTYQALYPNGNGAAYQLLGTFSGLDVTDAFGGAVPSSGI